MTRDLGAQVVRLDRQGASVVRKHRTGPEATEQVEREADVLRRARHPGVVDLLEHDAAGEPPHLLLTDAGLRTLADAAPLEAAPAAAVVAAVATTVADLAELGIAHRALRPDHVVLDERDRPRLCGFGAATASADPADHAADVGALGELLGAVLLGEVEVEPIPERRWRSGPRPEGFRRRSLLNLADDAAHADPDQRPSARQWAERVAALATDRPARRGRTLPARALTGPEDPPPLARPAPGRRRRGRSRRPVLAPPPGERTGTDAGRPHLGPVTSSSTDPLLEGTGHEPSTAGRPEPAAPDDRPDRTAPVKVHLRSPRTTPPVGPEPIGRPAPGPWRRAQVVGRGRGTGAALLALAVGVVVFVAALARSGPDGAIDRSAPAASRPAPCRPTTGPSVRLPGSRCPATVTVHDRELRVGGTRFTVGERGDAVTVGDWDCDGQATPALVRPASGAVYVFSAWPDDQDVRVRPLRTIPGAVAPMAVAGRRPSCPQLAIRRREGSSVTVPVTKERSR